MTPRVRRREWDSNLEAVVRGLYYLILTLDFDQYDLDKIIIEKSFL